MRILILDANYPGFLDGVYAADPALRDASYGEQRARIREGLFGEVNFQIDALREMGHEADSIIVNARYAQEAWAREHGFTSADRRSAWHLSRRGRLPWLTRDSLDVKWDLVIAQVRDFCPDAIYVGVLNTLPTAIVTELKRLSRPLVAQVATAIPRWDFTGYDLVLSSIPGLVAQFRDLGIRSEWMPLAFSHEALRHVKPSIRDVPVSFVGSFGSAYRDRDAVVEAVAQAAPLAIWTSDAARLRRASPLHELIRGTAYGRDMYRILGQSRITINTHGRISGADANNLRLYEATGMGCLLITDHRRNLGDLFDVGTEVVSFRTPGEAAELVRHYLGSPQEASRISAAGQARTLRDHTWSERMGTVVDLLQAEV